MMVRIEQSLSNSEGASETVCPGSREMDHRPSEAKRPGPLARDDGRNSWGPSWGLGRVLASSLLTSPPPPLALARPCLPGLQPGIQAWLLPPLPRSARLSWPQQRQHHVWCPRRQLMRPRGLFKPPPIASALPARSAQPLSSLPRSLCLALSLCIHNGNNHSSNNNQRSCGMSRRHGSFWFPHFTAE